jgi:hypothetical protein
MVEEAAQQANAASRELAAASRELADFMSGWMSRVQEGAPAERRQAAIGLAVAGATTLCLGTTYCYASARRAKTLAPAPAPAPPSPAPALVQSGEARAILLPANKPRPQIPGYGKPAPEPEAAVSTLKVPKTVAEEGPIGSSIGTAPVPAVEKPKPKFNVVASTPKAIPPTPSAAAANAAAAARRQQTWDTSEDSPRPWQDHATPVNVDEVRT